MVKIMKKFVIFSKKVVDVEIGCMGQGAWADIFIFIMEDGSVEYSDVKNMLTNVTQQITELVI